MFRRDSKLFFFVANTFSVTFIHTDHTESLSTAPIHWCLYGPGLISALSPDQCLQVTSLSEVALKLQKHILPHAHTLVHTSL